MSPFSGFPSGKLPSTAVPAPFFIELLPVIDHLGELKVTLYTIWRLERMEGSTRYLRREDFSADANFMAGMGAAPAEAEAALDEAIDRAVQRTVLLKASLPAAGGRRAESLYFLNTPKGRAAVEAIARGKWQPGSQAQMPVEMDVDRPNIFRLYEENIGPLTPLIAETLREAQSEYPETWIKDALQIAVEKNKRNWRYVAAILRRWQEEGRDEIKNRRDAEKDGRRYIEGEFSEYIKH